VTDRLTTPEAPEVQRLLRRMADAGCEFAIVESTSHGLALNRLDHVEYDIAAFTNITGDHLDFHKTFEAYREAKGRLFEALDTALHKGIAKTAVVNADDPSANYMLERSPPSRDLRARGAGCHGVGPRTGPSARWRRLPSDDPPRRG